VAVVDMSGRSVGEVAGKAMGELGLREGEMKAVSCLFWGRGEERELG
jgi:hypothetical protein